MSELIAIHVARKPLIGTVAKNALKHGTGGLNISVSRIGLASGDQKSEGGRKLGQGTERRLDFALGAGNPDDGKGRWPANLILAHKARCEQVGTKKVKPSNGSGVAHGQNASAGQVYGKGAFISQPKGNETRTYADPDGKETVDAWACVEGCPVADLDEQSGGRPVSGRAVTGTPHSGASRGLYHGGWGGVERGQLPNDKGGASRFFKQVQADE